MVTSINSVAILQTVLGTLTSSERLRAMTQFNTNESMEKAIITIGIPGIVLCCVLLIAVTITKKIRRQKRDKVRFAQLGRDRGLTSGQKQVLARIAECAGLREISEIFNFDKAFQIGASALIDKKLESGDTADTKNLRREIMELRDKLGFRGTLIGVTVISSKTENFSTRQIPVGGKIQICMAGGSYIEPAEEAQVMQNDDLEMVLGLFRDFSYKTGDKMRARYFFGHSIGEFDAAVINSDEKLLTVTHCDDVRFINRRRFLRVPVNKPAFVAKFPFAEKIEYRSDEKSEGVIEEINPPKFYKAVLKEIGGPGLRLESELDAEKGTDRLLVIFGVDDPYCEDAGMSGQVIEDIGEVRHCRKAENGFSIAVELTGLSERRISELVKVTNAASIGVVKSNIRSIVAKENKSVRKFVSV